MKISAEIEIDAPVKKVFDLFTDLEKIEDRVSGITSLEVLEGSPKMEKGTKWKETRTMMGKEASETMTVTEIQNEKLYIVDAASHGMEYRSTYNFEETNSSTKVSMVFEGKPVSLLAKIMTPLGALFKGTTRKALVADMTELKALAEK